MPTTRPRPNETREMRLFSKVIALTGEIQKGLNLDLLGSTDTSLPQFIARRRMPGEDWRSWDEIRYELTEVSGEIVSDGTIRKWASRYGIPEGTRPDGSGDVTLKVFAKALATANIEL